MKLTDLTYIPPITPSPQPTVPGNSVPLTSGNGQQTADSSKIVYGSNAGNGGGIEYPTASNEKVGASGMSGATALKSSQRKPPPRTPKPKPTPPPPPPPPPKPTPKPKPTPRPPMPPLKEGSPGIKDSFKTTQNINDLHDKNGFPPLSSELASSARNSLISGGVNSLVNIPLSVGEHMASKAIIDRIEAQAAMPGAAKKNADGTTTTVDPAATEKQKIDARLTNQEKTMDGIEAQLQDLGTRYDLVYKPYEAPKSSDAPTDKSRMDAIELRHKHMNRMIKRLITLVESDVT